MPFADNGHRAIILSKKQTYTRRLAGAVLTEETRGKRPRYYLQNFHFQSEGWMTNESAQRYDTQVEVFFSARKETPATRDAMLDMWVAALPSPATDILQAVASHRGPIAIDDLAARLNLAPRGGHWNTGVRMLRDNDLVAARRKRKRI